MFAPLPRVIRCARHAAPVALIALALRPGSAIAQAVRATIAVSLVIARPVAFVDARSPARVVATPGVTAHRATQAGTLAAPRVRYLIVPGT